MKGNRRCVHCRKSFQWYRSEKTLKVRNSLPRFCGHKCRLDHGGTGFRPGGNNRIDEATKEQKLERLKKSFEKNVLRQEGCWDWKGPKDKGGYGVMSCRRQLGSDRAHRSSWIIHRGMIPTGMFVCHHCDNPKCTNPDHLWIGTHKQNNDDKIKKGRQSNVNPPHKIGSQNGASKLKEEQVKDIKILLEKGLTSREIGKQYGVSKTTILRIKNSTHWKHV